MLSSIIDKNSIATFTEWLITYNRFVIIAHTNPDGDAVGASLALFNFLRVRGKKVSVVLPNQHPDFLKWMPHSQSIFNYKRYKDVADALIKEAEVICCLDFNSLSRIETLGTKVQESTAKKIMIDHHLDPENFCDVTISFPDQSSTCELLFRLMCDMGFYDTLDRTVASCLYTGMMTDTGGFTYNSNRPEIFDIIGMLLRKGVDKDLIYRKVNYNYSAGRLLMQGKILSEMEVLPEYHTAIISLSREQQKEFNYLKGDTEGLVNMPLQIKEVILTCFLKEDSEKDQVKVSIRSIGSFPSNELAHEFGGGGHKNAAGGEIIGVKVAEAREIFKKALTKYKDQITECFNKHPK